MKWLVFLRLPLSEEYLSAETRKSGTALQKKIDHLIQSQNALDKMETGFKQAPITEVQKWDEVQREYNRLLIKELQLRRLVKDWYFASSHERKEESRRLEEEEKKLGASILSDLAKVGYSAESLKGWNPLAVHPALRELRATRDGLRGDPHGLENREAIKWLESELERKRGRKEI